MTVADFSECFFEKFWANFFFRWCPVPKTFLRKHSNDENFLGGGATQNSCCTFSEIPVGVTVKVAY